MFSRVSENYRILTRGDLLEEMFTPASHYGKMNFPVKNPVVFLVNVQSDRPAEVLSGINF